MVALLPLSTATGCGAPGARASGAFVLLDARSSSRPVVVDGPSQCPRRCAVMLVDGFNNTLDESRENFEGISGAHREAGGACRVYGFTWRSRHGLFSFARAEAVADAEAAPLLRDELARLRERCPDTPVHVVGHSLAARVILGALALDVAATRPDPLRVDSVTLVAPAVAADALTPRGEFPGAVAAADRVLVLRNSEDYILSALYPLVARRRVQPLGAVGTPASLPLPGHVIELDLAAQWGPTHTALRSMGADFWRLHARAVRPRGVIARR